MKRLIFFLTLVCSSSFHLGAHCCNSLLPPPSFYCGNWYLGGFGGYNWLIQSKVKKLTAFDQKFNFSRSFKPGWIAGGNMGYAWDNGIHLEMEVSYRSNRRKSQNNTLHQHSTTALMANGFYQFHFDCLLPDFFVGGGLGYAKGRNKYEGSHEVKVRDGFPWQFLCGTSYRFFSPFELALTYRYFNESQGAFTHSSLDLGLRYHF